MIDVQHPTKVTDGLVAIWSRTARPDFTSYISGIFYPLLGGPCFACKKGAETLGSPRHIESGEKEAGPV